MTQNTNIEGAYHTIHFLIDCPKISDGCNYYYRSREQKRYGGDTNAGCRTNVPY